jgi:hypothetical protein
MKDQKGKTEVEQAGERCKDIPWGCDRCGTLLAFVDKETRSVIRIKHRDLYIYVRDPEEFCVVCRGCGEINKLEQVDDEAQTSYKENYRQV